MPIKKQLKATQRKAKPQIKHRCAVLFDTANKERRVDQSVNVKARTSFSTPLYEMKGTCYLGAPPHPSKLIHVKEVERTLEIVEALGLRVAGWIYSQADDRQHGGDEDGTVAARILFRSLRGILFTEPRDKLKICKSSGVKMVNITILPWH